MDVKIILDFFKEENLQNIKNPKIVKMFLEYEQAFEYLRKH